ncbi:phage holin [Metabacillus arenae]|uniref:PTS mannose transporter subunit IID n=1 Tax=Metabacillus arenae TaxID=2771434 RepID=A0A926NJH1_9BACI|nr:phage holin [Metabacillus arenae]MBD1379242.1 PTS mannose transporter subunit IID [Metabacillus arenae]
MNKDQLILIAGFLGSLKLFLASLGYNILTDDMINSFMGLIENGVPLVLVAYAVYKNTYTSPSAKRQKEVLEKYKDEWK